jgi:hypothetical protein
METQILKLEAPFDYIYCNGEVGKHIATYIVGESRIGEDGKYTLETHSHPIVQYKDGAKGVVWNRAELTDCEVLCSEDDMRIDVQKFFLLCFQQAESKDEIQGFSWENADGEAEMLKEKLQRYGIGFMSNTSIEEIGVEVGGCSDGYFAQLMGLEILYFHHIEPTLEELAKRLTEEREYWENLYDHVIKIKFTPESSLAEGFVENL